MKTKEIITADIFIIPNCAHSINTCIMDESKVDYKHLLYTNGFEYGKMNDEKLIQIWYCNPENNGSDWMSHGIDGYSELKGWRPKTSFIPAKLLEGKNDGDVVTFNLPIVKRDRENDITMETDIKVSVRLNQKAYRYARFGSFSDAYDYVMN